MVYKRVDMDIIFQKVDQLVNEGGRIIPDEFKNTIAAQDLNRYLLPYRSAIYLEKIIILLNDEKYLRIETEDLRKQFCVGEYEGYSVSTVMEKHGWSSVGHTLAKKVGFSSLEQIDDLLP